MGSGFWDAFGGSVKGRSSGSVSQASSLAYALHVSYRLWSIFLTSRKDMDPK